MSSKTERVVADLVEKVPKMSELEGLLRDVSVKHARRLLVDRLLEGGLSESQLDVVRDALAHLDPHPEEERLVGLVLDQTRTLAERGTAYFLASERAEPRQLQEAFAEPELLKLAEVVPFRMLSSLRTEPGYAYVATSFLLEAEAEEGRWMPVLAQLEKMRAAAKVPAALVYGPTLAAAELETEHHNEVLALVAGDDCDETVELLADLIVASEEGLTPARVTGAWQEARARRARAYGGEAWVSTEDADGLVTLFGWFRDRPDPDPEDRHTLVVVQLLDAELVDSRMEPLATEEFVRGFVDDYADTHEIELEELTLAAAAELVRGKPGGEDGAPHAAARRLFEVNG